MVRFAGDTFGESVAKPPKIGVTANRAIFATAGGAVRDDLVAQVQGGVKGRIVWARSASPHTRAPDNRQDSWLAGSGEIIGSAGAPTDFARGVQPPHGYGSACGHGSVCGTIANDRPQTLAERDC